MLMAWLLPAQDNLIRVYGAPDSGGFSQPRILSGHQRRAGVDGVLALVVMEGDQLVSAGRDGRIIVWKDGVEAGDEMGNQVLVGGLEHEFYFPIYWEFHHPN